MTRSASDNTERSPRVEVPDWWPPEANRVLRDERNITRDELAAMMTRHLRREKPIHKSTVDDFLSGKRVTKVMVDTFLVLFPEMPPPTFMARSVQAARRFMTMQLIAEPPMIKLPDWWVDDVERRVRKSSPEDVARQLSGVARGATVTAKMVADVIATKHAGLILIEAFLRLYTDMLSPLYVPQSYAEAHKHHLVAEDYGPSQPTPISSTIDDTGEGDQLDVDDRSDQPQPSPASSKRRT